MMNPHVIIVPSELFVGIELYMLWLIEFDWISCTNIKLICRRIIEERLELDGGINN